ncbi:DUF637 domain-containing protein, partial [Acinetobacter pittii]
NLTSKGVTSVTATGNQVLQNTNLTGGAVLLEAGGFILGQTGLNLNAVGSDLLKNHTKLNSLNGDLTIQTNSNLTIDPKVYSLKAVGDIELVSKTGTLTLKGYGGTAGNGSEQVVKLDTANGGINLEGAKVELQGSNLKAAKDISIVSTNGDLVVDGVRNTITNQHTDEYKAKIIKLDEEIKILQKSSDYEAIIAFFMKEALKVYARISSGELIEGSPEMDRELQKALQKTTKEFPEYVSKYGPLRDQKDFYSEMIKLFNVGYVNGEVHSGSKIISNTGNIQLVSNKGLSISGSSMDAKDGKVNLEAAGALDGEGYNIQGKYNNPTENSVKKGVIKGSIIIDANQDSYEQGSPSDNDYRWFSPVSPTTINGTKGVSIKVIGKQSTDNLILQGVAITSENDVNIEAYKNIIFDVAINNSFNKSQKTETKSKWYGKKKTITTTQTDEKSGGLSVDIDAKNINIKSQAKNTPAMSGQNRTSIDMYSSQLTAIDGKINIQAGGDLNFLTADDVSLNTTDISKKSSFLGVKLNKSHTTNTRNVKSELPAELNADYIGTKSGFDTRLKGTVFNYLEGAEIQAGGTITLESASTTVTETLKKESNSVVWQSMQDKGSITETAQLPSFNGPVLPTFIAAGGLSVQVPISEKDVNKVELRNEILKLANQPGNAYLKELVNRKDVDWQTVLLTQKDWDYKSQGLTGAGAAIIVIIVTIVTMGSGTAAAAGAAGGAAASGTTVGLGASMLGAAGVTTTAAGAIVPSALGAMANAAITSLAAQASVGLINNGGDIGKTLKDLGSKDSIKNLAASVVTAGLMSQVGSALNLKPDSTLLPDRLANNFASSVGSTLVQTAIKGGDLGDNLQVALLAGLAGALQGELAQNLKGLEDVNYILHKIAHAAVGCAAAAATKQSCEAGAIGAGVGEIIAQEMLHGRNPTFVSAEEKAKIEAYSKLIAGTISAYAGYDVNTAANSATIAIQNNAFKDKALLKLEATRKYLDDKSKAALDGLINAYKKGDIEAAKKFKNQLDDSVTTWANSSSSYLNIETKSALGEIVIVVSDLVIPTNYVEILPVGKLSKVAKILKIGEDGTKSAGRLAEELAELQKVDIKFGKTLPGAKAPITVTAESNIGGKHMFDTNQTARPEVNRTNTPTLAAGNAKIDPSNPNLTMKNAHAEIALIQRAYDAGLTKGETMQVLVRGKEVCDHCGQVMKTMYERSGLAKLIIHDTTSGSTTTYYKVIDAKTNIATTKIVVSPIFGH